jgi:hypothetical protein
VGISDEEYYLYGADQDPTRLRLEYLPTALEISDVGLDSNLFAQSPGGDAAGGVGGLVSGGLPGGANRYPCFRTLMEAEYQNFLDGLKALTETVAAPKANPAPSRKRQYPWPPLPQSIGGQPP